MVKRGKTDFQLQTEYAGIPRPRVTTTIFSRGEVLHKVEKTIDTAVDSIEAMHRVEEIIKTQHQEISQIIREKGLPIVSQTLAGLPQGRMRSEQIQHLDGVERVYLITPDGKIVGGKETTKEFRSRFKHIFNALPELITVFSSLPGKGERREEGVYEVEPGRILLASTGVEFYLILIRAGMEYDSLAAQIRTILGR